MSTKKTKTTNIHTKVCKHIKSKKNKKNKKTKKGGASILETATISFMDNLFFYVMFILAFFTVIGIIGYYVKSTIKKTTAKIVNAPAKIANVASAAATKTAEVASAAATKTAEVASGIGEVAAEEGVKGVLKPQNPVTKAIMFGDEDAIKELYNIEKNPETGEYAVQDSEEPSAQGFVNATFKSLIGVFGFGENDAIRKLEAADKLAAADEYFQNPDTSILSSTGSSKGSSTGSNRIFSSENSVIIPEAGVEPIFKSAPTILDNNYMEEVDFNSFNNPLKSDDSFKSAPTILDNNYMEAVDFNSFNNPLKSDDSFKSTPNILEVDRVEPFLKSAPTILQGKQASIFNDEIQNLRSAPTILENNYMEEVKGEGSYKDAYEDFKTSLPKTRPFRTIGGSSNNYGPKKITIYKILGLLLLSLYLEHYKK